MFSRTQGRETAPAGWEALTSESPSRTGGPLGLNNCRVYIVHSRETPRPYQSRPAYVRARARCSTVAAKIISSLGFFNMSFVKVHQMC